MPRSVSTALELRLLAQVTAVGYLLRMTAPAMDRGGIGAVLQLCDIGTVVNSLGTFAAEDFTISGAGTEAVTLRMQNVNSDLSAYVLNVSDLGSVEIMLWQFERAVPDDFVLLGDFRAANAKLGIDAVTLALRQVNMAYTFAPRMRITARDGFKHALRPGETFLWGAQRIVIREND